MFDADKGDYIKKYFYNLRLTSSDFTLKLDPKIQQQLEKAATAGKLPPFKKAIESGGQLTERVLVRIFDRGWKKILNYLLQNDSHKAEITKHFTRLFDEIASGGKSEFVKFLANAKI